MELTLNIGLDRKKYGRANVGHGTALRDLALGGFVILAHAGYVSDTEDTLVVKVRHEGSTPRVANALFHISTILSQDCIAVVNHTDNTQTLIGPFADKWLPFNPAYFLNLDGTRLA